MTDKPKGALINVDKGYREKYNELEKDGPLKGKAHKVLFLLAVCLGLKKGRKPLKRKDFLFRRAYLNEEEMALCEAIALGSTKDIDYLKKENEKEIYDIIEEYANSGFVELQKLAADPGTFLKKLDSMIRKELKSIKGIDI